MTADVVYLKMPFRYKWIYREKEVPFLFKIMTLEMACDYLGVDFGELFTKDDNEHDSYLALIWNGYLAATKELYQKPKFTEAQAIYWAEHMSISTRDALLEETRKLLGYLQEFGKPKKEGDEKKK